MSDNVDTGKVVVQEVWVGKRKIHWYFSPELSENAEYIKYLSTEFYRFKLNRFAEVQKGEEWTRFNLLALQQNYFEMLEFALALAFASIQSAYALPVWLTEYRTSDLEELVGRVRIGERLPSISEGNTATLLNSMSKGRREDSLASITEIWNRIIEDYGRVRYRGLYNAIKHGNRASPASIDIEADQAIIKMKCGVQIFDTRRFHPHEVDIPSGVKGAYHLERYIYPIDDLSIFVQNIIIIQWLEILIDVLKVGIGEKDHIDDLPLVSLEEVQRAWSLPEGSGILMITPDFFINGKRRVADEFRGANPPDEFVNIDI